MANFQTHMIVASAVSTFVGSILYGAHIVTVQEAMAFIVLGMVGGILPDVDSDQSVPIRIVFQVLSLVLAFMVLFAVIPGLGILYGLLLWLVIYLSVRYGGMRFFSEVTTHRGMIHSVPMAAIVGLVTVLISKHFFNLTDDSAWFAGFFLTMGFLIHLILDEIFSVDLLGAQLKKSFGSAFTFFSIKEPWGYFVLYTIVCFLYWISPPISHFLQTYFSIEMIDIVSSHLFPAQHL